MNTPAHSTWAFAPTVSRRWAPTCGLLFLLVQAPALAAEPPAPVKLNDPLVEGGDVSSQLFSPDGQWVVYWADQETDGTFELFSVPVGGGAVVKLNPPLVADGDVSPDIGISADSATVVFRAQVTTPFGAELFSVPIGGGAVTRLSDPLPAGGGIFGFDLTPDGQTVVYGGEQITDGVNELFSVPIGGGDVTRLSPPGLGDGRNVLGGRRISPDSSTVVYLADQNTDFVDELFAVPVGGGEVVRLNSDLPVDGDIGIFGFEISPDGATVVYTGDQEVNNRLDLYSVPIGGGAFTRLNEIDVDTFISDFRLTSDGSRVVFLDDGGLVNGPDKLSSAAIGGGPVTQLSDPLHDDLFHFDISTDSDFLVYMASGADVNEVFSVPVTGGAVTRLNAPLPEGETVSFFVLSADGNRVVFDTELVTDVEIARGLGIFSVPTGGGAIKPLTPPIDSVRGTQGFAISPDSRFVLFAADLETDNVIDLFGVPIDGGAVLKLNGPMVEGGSLRITLFSPTSAAILFTADKETDEVVELFSVSTGAVLNSAPVVTSFEVQSATGTGPIQGQINGGGENCSIDQVAAVLPDDVAAQGLEGIDFEHGLLDFTLAGCTPSASVTITLTFPSALPQGAGLFKFGPTPDNPTPGLYEMPASLSGATATYTITDGGLGDDDLSVNGVITDPVGPGTVPAAAPAPGAAGPGVESVPTLQQWALLLMSLLLLGVGMRHCRP